MTAPLSAEQLLDRLKEGRSPDHLADCPCSLCEAIRAIDALTADLARLQEERDEARAQFDRHVEWADDQIVALTKYHKQAKADAQRDLLARIREIITQTLSQPALMHGGSYAHLAWQAACDHIGEGVDQLTAFADPAHAEELK